MNILFRCDGSVSLGMGHVIRSLALADSLRDNYSSKVQFAMRKSELGISKVRGSYPVIESDEDKFQYEKWLIDSIQKTNTHILVLDVRDGLSQQALNHVKMRTKVIVVCIDDPEEKRLEADLAFYPPVPQLEQLGWEGFEGQLFSGWEYVILRKEFLNYYSKSESDEVNILVSMGGTDEQNMTQTTLGYLTQIPEPFKTTIIIGSGYPFVQQLHEKLKHVPFEYELFQNPENIAEVMTKTDLAIISFGQTAYELAALKIPAVYLCLTDDHAESSTLFEREGLGVSLGVFTIDKSQLLIEKIRSLIGDKHVVMEMANQAKLINVSDLNQVSQLIHSAGISA